MYHILNKDSCILYLVTKNVLWLFLTMQWVGLQCVVVVFPDHIHLLFKQAFTLERILLTIIQLTGQNR